MTLWVRRHLIRSRRREAFRLAAFALFGVAFGVAAFLAFEVSEGGGASISSALLGR